MKAIKHFSILMLALCCSFWANAQCPTTFHDVVTGNTVTATVPSASATGYNFSWYLDGTLVSSHSADSLHIFQNVLQGTHHICMYAYPNNSPNFCDSVCQSVTVTSCGTLTAQWSDIIATHDTVRFTAYDTNTVAHHGWNFGDGTSFSGGSTTHVYSAPGTYHVCFYDYFPGTTCIDSLCETVVVPSTCGVASFAAYVLGDTAIRGYSTSTGTDSTNYFVWYVYNSSNTLIQTQSGHTANFLSHGVDPGTYRVCLYLYNSIQQLCDSACNSVTVLNCSSINAQWTYSAYANSDSVRFNVPTNNPGGTVYSWSFGDGVTSTAQSLTHTYAHAGTYTVCLIVSNTAVICHDTLCRSVVVTGPSTACGVASFNDYVFNDTSIHAYSTSTGTDTNMLYVWYIRNSTGNIVQTIYGRNLVAINSQRLGNGTYRLCLYLYNDQQQLCDSSCNSVVLSGCPGITAQWTYTVSHDTVTFIAADTVTNASHYWNFGDGSTGSGIHVTHVYPNYGNYHVCFYDYRPGLSCMDSLCETVTVPNTTVCGTASFSSYVYNDTSIHAISTSTNTSNTSYYSWTIKGANGNVIQTQGGTTNYIISHHLTPGNYTVCLKLYNGSVFCDSICNQVTVPLIGYCGTPGFRDTVYAGLGGGAIHAYTTSTTVDSLSQYSWKIWGPHGNLVQTFTGGDFTSSVLDSGTYVVCQYIRATASTYICDSLCSTVVVGGGSNPCNGLNAAWTHILSSNTTDSIEFIGAANPSGTLYYWIFGDGTYGTGQSVKHGYAHTGTYTACLQVVIPNTNCIDSSCQSINITTTVPCPVASFNQYVYQDTMIHAYSNSTGVTANTVYQWYVTNSAGVVVQSATATGTSTNFLSHGLPNGTYNLCLYVYANANTFCDSTCHSITIHDTISPCSGLNAHFTATYLNNGNVQFIPTDTAAGVSHYWHFGDGTVSTNNDPTHAYNSGGLYHVCQYVYYAGSTCVDSFCTNVQASASGCNASFTYQDFYPPHNGVQFTSHSTSTDSIIYYRWSFGDSTTASFANGSHVFPHSGKWYVCLSIYTQHGCSSTYCDSVNVSYQPCTGLSANYTYTYTQGGGVHFAGSTTITNVTNYWTFGDGTSATTFDPIHYYTQAGTYTVCHIVTLPGTLCADTSCQTVQGTGVGTSCHANFTDSTSANSTTVLFTNHSTSSDSIVSYAWTFGDGSTSTSANTHHTYTASGSAFYVCLTITTANGCSSTYCDSVHVGHISTACHASFNYTIDSCQRVTFTSTSTGSLSFLRWVYGDGTTDTLSHPTHVYAQGGSYTVILHFYGNNGCYQFDTVQINVPSCTAVGDTLCGVVFSDLNGNGVQNTGEAGIPNAEIHVGSYTTHADSTGHYVIVVPAGTYNIYYCPPTGYTFTIPVHVPLNTNSTCAVYQNVTVTGGAHCGYNFGIQSNSVTICGTVYFDANNNHTQDPNESGISNTSVTLTSSTNVVVTAYTDQYGHYCVVVPVGTYVVTTGTANYHNGVVTPGSITVTATAPGGSYDNTNFGVYVQPGGCDLSINVTPNTTITPGFPAWYQIEVCNVGANVTSGTVNLFYDPSLHFNYGSPVPASQNSTTFTSSWTLTNLNPGSCQYYYVSLTADSNLAVNQFIFTLANVTTNGCTDVNQANNVDTVHQNVTASWDPNNKEVSPAGKGIEGLINGDQQLTYTINFQNTGNAPAANIVILDTLSNYLDLATFKMLGASHPYTMQLMGNVAVWRFNSVMLPDSGTDQQGSHGFVTFMITPLQGLASKTQITNSADIFFDYNAGVSTNRTLNTIDYSLSVNQISADNVTITLQPNPFNQYTTVKVDGSEGPYQLNVYDMLGRQVKNQNATGNVFNIDRGSMAAGLYMYEIVKAGTVIGKGKMIAQ